jgi:multisubunit Na+/H+ antiporter MnhB subunit
VIYTDRSSLRQHYQTIQRTLAGVLSVELIIGVFNLSNIWNRTADYSFTGMGLIAAVFQGVITLLLAYGYAAMRRKIKAISVR